MVLGDDFLDFLRLRFSLQAQKYLLSLIESYREKIWPCLDDLKQLDEATESKILDRFEAFIREAERPCHRETLHGHITGSAIVVNPSFDKIVLTLHAKLGKWLQLGGHADGSHFVHEVAMREVNEESGLTELSYVTISRNNTFEVFKIPDEQPLPFDFDIHPIPARKNEPEHYHYDIRYIIVADDKDLTITDESHDLKWCSLSEARELCAEESMHRQIDKIEAIKHKYFQ